MMEQHFLSTGCNNQASSKLLNTKYFGEDWIFSEAFSEQLKAVDKVTQNPDQVFLLSGVHHSVFTLGNSLKKHGEAAGAENFVQTDRGGRVMYHGPGQLTVYPIFKLQHYFTGPREYTKFLFDVCIEHFKKHHQIELVCRNNGLWTQSQKKVGFVGLRIKNGVTYHGLSLNYNADLSAFLKHSPCDISGEQAGNLMDGLKLSDAQIKTEAELLSAAFFDGLTLRQA